MTEKMHLGPGGEGVPLSQQVRVSGGQWGKGSEEATSQAEVPWGLPRTPVERHQVC